MMLRIKQTPQILLFAFIALIFMSQTAFSQEMEVRDSPENKVKAKMIEAAAAYKSRDFAGSIALFQEAETMASAIDNDQGRQLAAKAHSNTNKLFYSVAKKLADSEKFTEALSFATQAQAYDPSYAKHFYLNAYILGKQEDDMGAIDMYTKTMEVAETSNNQRVLGDARRNIISRYVAMATRANEANNPAQAIEYLDAAGEFSAADADRHYYYAIAYNAQGKYDQAATHAQESIDLEQGNATKKARAYFELGMAHKNSNQIAAAKAAFEGARFGQFKTRAEYELEYLES